MLKSGTAFTANVGVRNLIRVALRHGILQAVVLHVLSQQVRAMELFVAVLTGIAAPVLRRVFGVHPIAVRRRTTGVAGARVSVPTVIQNPGVDHVQDSVSGGSDVFAGLCHSLPGYYNRIELVRC